MTPIPEKVDTLIAGAGISGITAARILAEEKGQQVLVVEKRPHIGGNCFDCVNEDGILIHLYGPHIFHTRHKSVWQFLSRFTDWTGYTHRVLAFANGKHLSFPINITTFEQLFDRPFSKQDVQTWLETEKIQVPVIENAEQMVLSRMGRTLYDTFFKQYTRKQWGMDASELDPGITARIPIRMDRDDRFFTDPFQGMPAKGYTALFEKMLDHPGIRVVTGRTLEQIKTAVQYQTLIHTGPIDAFFKYHYGPLPYRGIRFDFKTYNEEQHLQAPVVNYPNDHAYTRATEFKQLTGQVHPRTTLCYEYPMDAVPGSADPVPAYPVLTQASDHILSQYKREAARLKNTIFLGRLGRFEYLNMDACVKQVMDLCQSQPTGTPVQ